jgi:hypothetical protein
MKIRHLLLPSGITEGIPLLIEARWTPEQAVAVFELLDDLREQIVRHYTPQIQAYYRGNRVQDGRPQGANPEIDSEPF